MGLARSQNGRRAPGPPDNANRNDGAAMMPRFSIIVPSLGKIEFLTRLIDSINAQDFERSVEFILCMTGAPADLREKLPALNSNIRFIFKDSPRRSISTARNIGIAASQGEILLFLDDDCFLPGPGYLKTVSQFCDEHPGAAGGGFYLTPGAENDFSSAFYNYICNSWVQSHAVGIQQAGVLLGGCCFYTRKILIEKDIYFPEENPRAGEESSFNQKILRSGYRLHLDPRWSVYHHPRYSLDQVFKRAWTQGLSIERHDFIPRAARLKNFVGSQKSPREFIKFLPMTVAYSLWGRVAFASKLFQKETPGLPERTLK